MNITGLQIELPYSFRSYMVGQKPEYSGGSGSQDRDMNYGKVISITIAYWGNEDNPIIFHTIEFEDGRRVEIQNGPGIILNYEPEDSDDK